MCLLIGMNVAVVLQRLRDNQLLIGTSYILFLFVRIIDGVEFQDPKNCNENEVFNSRVLRCVPCPTGTIAVAGLRCGCTKKAKQTYEGNEFKCVPCEPNQVTTVDGKDCIACSNASANCDECPAANIIKDRDITGKVLADRACALCELPNTQPNADRTMCVPCEEPFSLTRNGRCECQQPGIAPVGAFCIGKNLSTNIPTHSSMFQIPNDKGDQKDSLFLTNNLQAAFLICKIYRNDTFCQMLGNTCVMMHYIFSSTTDAPNACNLYTTSNAPILNAKVPLSMMLQGPSQPVTQATSLYYQERNAEIDLNQEVPVMYDVGSKRTNRSRLDIVAAAFDPKGKFLGFRSASEGILHLCPGAKNDLKSAYVIGTRFHQRCAVGSRDLLKSEMVFYDLYLRYNEGGRQMLMPIPILNQNYKLDGISVNRGNIRQWQLVRRLFLVDNLSSRTKIDDPLSATALRYASYIHLKVPVDHEKVGKIKVPLLVVRYAEIRDEELKVNRYAPVVFETDYVMNQEKSEKDISITMGVLSTVTVLYAAGQTWSWSRRSGRFAVDFLTLMKLLLFFSGAIANIFFLVVISICLYWFIFYKNEDVLFLVIPTANQELYLLDYIYSAFALKLSSTFHLLLEQVNCDIFFIDWERPRTVLPPVTSKSEPKNFGSTKPGVDVNASKEGGGVSVWRTYFIAKTFLSLQTIRCSNTTLQLFLVMVLLKVFGFEYLAKANTFQDFYSTEHNAYTPYSVVCRIGLIVTVYTAVWICQCAFCLGLYRQFVEDRIAQFPDICSMCNISVLILQWPRFGYYIHGRSVHGHADTDYKTLFQQLKREEDNLCGERGLLPNTKQQTFQLSVSAPFTKYYERIRLSALTPRFNRLFTSTRSTLGSNYEAIVIAYNNLNVYLTAFLDHALRELDYTVRDKLIAENLLNTEFHDALDVNTFYNDNGHSFDACMFDGHEFELFTTELISFVFVDVLTESIILATVLTYFLSKMLSHFRRVLGRSNLCRKALLDERFLV